MADFRSVEEAIGYKFHNQDLLQQAFVRRSYSEENGGQNNEILEFIGDKALDLAVVRILAEEFGVITEDKEYQELKLKNPKWFKTRHAEGAFTDIKKDLVEKKALAAAMRDLGFHEMLIMGRGDENLKIEQQDSVQEDLFEAIVGAVAVDSNWNMDDITRAVENMIDFEGYFESVGPDENYVGKLQEWWQSTEEDTLTYLYRPYGDEVRAELHISVDGDELHSYGYGVSRAAARSDCAEAMWNQLWEKGYVKSDYELAVGEPSREDALKQINELVQKGLIEKPSYRFKEERDEDGTYWGCFLVSKDDHDAEWEYADTKREAQRQSAYAYLCFLMDYEPEE